MSLRCLGKIGTTAVVSAVLACGTEVEVGRNDDPDSGLPRRTGAPEARQTAPDDSRENERSSGSEGQTRSGSTEGTQSADNDSTEQTGEGDGGNSWGLRSTPKRGSCFSIPDRLPREVARLCEKTPSSLRSRYSMILTSLCEKRHLVNLIQPKCGWKGDGDPISNYTVLNETPADAQGQEAYELYSAARVTNQERVDHFLEWTLAAYKDSEAMRKKGYSVSKIATTFDGHGDAREEGLTYEMKMAPSGNVVKFTGKVKVLRLSEHAAAVFNFAAKAHTQNMKRYNQLILIQRFVDGPSVILNVENKKVLDGGNHELAGNVSRKLTYGKMRIFLDNAKHQ